MRFNKLWLPILVAVLGVLLSCIMFLIAWHSITNQTNLLALPEKYIPGLILLLGIGVSILLAVSIGAAQIARERTLILKETNENLKREINERINAEESKQKLEVALLQGQKLQSIGTLAGGIAHDFNNILYAIIGYIELGRADVAEDSLIYKNLGKVLEAAHRGQELISRILAFSRRQHHNFEPINLRQTIEAALSLLKPTIPASVMIEIDKISDATILGNQTQIHQVLVNIINNAVDAMEGEGTITLTMSHIPPNDPFLKEFPEILPGTYCKIEISDTGHGMDQHTMERIFEPFFTTKEVGKGTGLGLSIVHSIIKEHQGEITLHSQLGHGTTFVILLPEYKPT